MRDALSEEDLRSLFRIVADGEAGLASSRQVEERLATEVRSIGRARRRVRNAGFALSAALMMAVSGAILLRLRGTRPSVGSASPAVAGAQKHVAGEVAVQSVFFSLGYSDVPTSDAHIVEMEVPKSALESFGMPAGRSSAASVLADVIVGDDGLARAVRFELNRSRQGGSQ